MPICIYPTPPLDLLDWCRTRTPEILESYARLQLSNIDDACVTSYFRPLIDGAITREWWNDDYEVMATESVSREHSTSNASIVYSAFLYLHSLVCDHPARGDGFLLPRMLGSLTFACCGASDQLADAGLKYIRWVFSERGNIPIVSDSAAFYRLAETLLQCSMTGNSFRKLLETVEADELSVPKSLKHGRPWLLRIDQDERVESNWEIWNETVRRTITDDNRLLTLLDLFRAKWLSYDIPKNT